MEMTSESQRMVSLAPADPPLSRLAADADTERGAAEPSTRACRPSKTKIIIGKPATAVFEKQFRQTISDVSL